MSPPVEAAASTAAATWALKPIFFIMGMVKDPVITAFAVLLPEIDPISPLDRTATFAGPPRNWPATAVAKSMVNCPNPDFSRNAPNTMNRKMNVAEMPVGKPNRPSGRKYWLSTTKEAE